MFKKLVYLDLLLVFLIQRRILAFQPVTENNHVLVGHVFQQLYSRDWFSCIQACQDEPRCISYNYERSARANGLCELNDSGVEDLCDRDKSLIYSVGFVFQQIRESEDKNKCTLDEKPSGTKQRSGNPTQPPVGGSWSQYGAWSECSESCGGGIRNRSRTCTTPPCVGNTDQVTDCNVYSCDGPSDVPQTVRAVNKTMHSIGVTWDEVPDNNRNGDILSYTISYHSDTTDSKHDKVVVKAPRSFVNILQLTNNTNYTITVLASNYKGNGPASTPIVVTTSDGSVFQCPQVGNGWFRDPNSCFRYYWCSNNGREIQHIKDCAQGKEFKPSVGLIVSVCSHPSKPYCHV